MPSFIEKKILGVGEHIVKLSAELKTNADTGSKRIVITSKSDEGYFADWGNTINIFTKNSTEKGYEYSFSKMISFLRLIGEDEIADGLIQKVEKEPTFGGFLPKLVNSFLDKINNGINIVNLKISENANGEVDNNGYIKLECSYSKLKEKAVKVDDTIPFNQSL